MTIDRLQRSLTDLRLSVTDRCNFRCRYCLPGEMFDNGFRFMPHSEILRYEEMTSIVRVMSGLGVRHVRLTGGEPLVRRDLPALVAMLKQVEGIHEISLTTNGSLLSAELSRELFEAGLNRVTISLDALDPATASRMAGIPLNPQNILRAIENASAAGLYPVKVNMVVRRGYNENEILKMAATFREMGHMLRFIEFMDVGSSNGWNPSELVSADEILRILNARWPIEHVASSRASATAQCYRYRDNAGEIGVIASVTYPFCRSCTRVRLSADGHLYTCLFASQGVDLRGPLRNGADERDLADLIRSTWERRADRYSELRGRIKPDAPKVEMSRIGG